MKLRTLYLMKLELAVKAKKGIDFIISSSITWFIITGIWLLNGSAYKKSIYVFMVGALMLPLAFSFSRIFKTKWKLQRNELQPLGLWLNFAQLFYFPFLVFILLHIPEYFLMTYAIITGAHLFPYAWLYDDNTYAIMAGLISALSLIMGLNFEHDQMYIIAVMVACLMLLMFVLLYRSIQTTSRKWKEISSKPETDEFI